jgi:hypothetical protein
MTPMQIRTQLPYTALAVRTACIRGGFLLQDVFDFAPADLSVLDLGGLTSSCDDF